MMRAGSANGAGVLAVTLLAIAGVVAPSLPARAQVPDLPDSLAGQHLVIRTERFASTHTTSLAGDYRVESPVTRGTVRTFMLSSTSLLGSVTTKDQIDAVVDLEYLLPGAMRLMVLTEGTLSNDVRNNLSTLPGINNTASTFAGIGGRYTDAAGTRIGVAVGGAYNRQLNVEDAGLALYGELAAALDLGDYRVMLDGTGRWQNLAPRHNANGALRARVDRQYDEGAYGSLDLSLDATKTDLYLKRPEQDVLQFGGLSFDALQSRAETRVRVAPQLHYPVSDDLAFDLLATIGTVTLGQQERPDELPPLSRDPVPFHFGRGDLETGVVIAAQWRPRSVLFDARLEYVAREQRNTVDPVGDASEIELRRRRESGAQNDFVSRQLQLAGNTQVLLGAFDTVGVNASASIYRYDTPSRTNYFDRDEQVFQAQLRYARSFSANLSFSLTGQVFVTHLVYLFGQNSNDNNWNRVFRIFPSVRYELPGVARNRFEAEVLANYTDYDFEGRTQNVRGRSYRELRLRDSLDVTISSTLGLSARGEVRISERGSFSWGRFAESLLERTRTEGLEAEAYSGVVGGMTFAAGGRLARAKSFRVGSTNDLEPYSDITSFGPTARVRADVGERTQVEGSGWWEHRFEESTLVARVPWLFLTISVRL
ncbi:MAG TPA: hypothetical protein VNA88_06055 [Candidatus Kapabacteria bacterium]|nr:hypothetical protein [Candidatus Kapabacteria bacterium]